VQRHPKVARHCEHSRRFAAPPALRAAPSILSTSARKTPISSADRRPG
jgi:hypothetical protein